MDSPSSTGNASNHATGEDKRKRKADTLANDVNDGGVGPSVCCPCVHCDRQCKCHEVDEANYLDSVPIGYRFKPTDEELIIHYLRKKILKEKLPQNKIHEVYIYGDRHPKDFVVNYPQAVEGEWYFFTSRTRKYVNGKRPSRTAGSGYWKATGLDKDIMYNKTKIGGKKALVYHVGSSPKGVKTEWMMHEYVTEGEDYERKRSNLQDMKLDDYVICKIYTKKGNGKDNEEGVNDQQPREENVVTEAREQVMVPDQQARVVSNQHINPTSFQVRNNNVVHSNQSSSSIIPHVENGSPSMGRQVMVPDQQARVVSNQHINPTSFKVRNNNIVRSNQSSSSIIPHVENGSPSMGRQVMVPDQQARVVSNQHINPTSFKVRNNNVVRSNQSSSSIIPHVENSSPSMGRQVMILPDDQQARPTINLRFENNLVIQNYQNMGTFNNLIRPYSGSLQPVQRTCFPELRAPDPLMHNYSLTPFNNNYPLPNSSYFPPTPRKSPPLPRNNVNSPLEDAHVNPEMYQPGSSSNPRSPTFQESNGDDEDSLLISASIKNMFSQDGNVSLDDIYPLLFDGNEQLDIDKIELFDFDESKKKHDERH